MLSFSVSEQREADWREGGGQLASVLIRRFTFARMQTIILKGKKIVSYSIGKAHNSSLHLMYKGGLAHKTMPNKN